MLAQQTESAVSAVLLRLVLNGIALVVQAVMIHQLSKQATQNPFRKNRGRVSRVLFHPSKPFLLVATEHHVRVYNLVKQALARKLVGSSGGFTCLAIHSSGDHVLAGALRLLHPPEP